MTNTTSSASEVADIQFPFIQVEYTKQYDDEEDESYAGYRWLLLHPDDYMIVLSSSLEREHLFLTAEAAFSAAVQAALVYNTLVTSRAQCVMIRR